MIPCLARGGPPAASRPTHDGADLILRVLPAPVSRLQGRVPRRRCRGSRDAEPSQALRDGLVADADRARSLGRSSRVRAGAPPWQRSPGTRASNPRRRSSRQMGSRPRFESFASVSTHGSRCEIFGISPRCRCLRVRTLDRAPRHRREVTLRGEGIPVAGHQLREVRPEGRDEEISVLPKLRANKRPGRD